MVDGVVGEVIDDLKEVFYRVLSQFVDVECPRCGAGSCADAKT